MKHLLVSVLCVLLICGCDTSAPSVFSDQDERDIRAVLAQQQEAWNEYAIDRFMEGYWKSDSLEFIGSKITTGWLATLERYKTSYPNPDAMGVLRFEIHAVKGLSAGAALVTGRYTLARKADTPTGMFTLLFKKINNKWVIVYDHTS